MSATIQWKKTPKKLAALAPDVLAYFRTVAPDIAETIENRSKRARLPNGGATAPLTKRAAGQKKRDGAQPIRNFDWTRQMWNGKAATIRRRQTKITKATKTTQLALAIGFDGAHLSRKGRNATVARKRKDKQGNTIQSRQTKTNQMVANAAARVDAAGRRLPEGIAKVPYHNFMDLTRAEWREVARKFGPFLATAWRKLGTN